MQRREFLANAAKAVPVAGVYAAAAVAHRNNKGPDDLLPDHIAVPLFFVMDSGRVRFMIWADPAEVQNVREEKTIAEIARRSVDRFLEAVAADPTGSQRIPGFATSSGYEWDAETFTREPDPMAKLPHLRDPKRGLRFLLLTIVAEDLCRFAWHRQGRMFDLNAALAIGAFVDADSPCPRYDDDPAGWYGAEPLLSPENAAKFRAMLEHCAKLGEHVRSEIQNPRRPV